MAYSEEHHGDNPRGRGWIVISAVIVGFVLALVGTGYTAYKTGTLPDFVADTFGLEQPSTTGTAGESN